MGNVSFPFFQFPFCNPQEVAGSSRISRMLQGLPEIVKVIEAAGRPMLLIVHSLALQELAYISWARL